MSLDRKILDRIERENIKIKPKWFFAVKNLVFGAGTFSASILGSLSLALLLEIMANQGKNLTWLSVPYLYLILLGTFLLGGYWLVTKVDSLYKMKLVPVVALLFFVSLSFGYLTFASGKAGRIERELEEVPIYAKIISVDREIPLEAEGRHRYQQRIEKGEERRNDRDDDRQRDENKSSDNNEQDRNNGGENTRRFELKNENNDDEIKASEKTQSVDADEEDLEKGEVNGVSKEAVENETKDDEKEEIAEEAEEKEDSDNDAISSSEDTLEDDESEVVDED